MLGRLPELELLRDLLTAGEDNRARTGYEIGVFIPPTHHTRIANFHAQQRLSR